MNRLSDLLERALRLHDCVALPSVGAFLKEYCYAHYNEEDNSLYPASEFIHFNADLSHRDGVLDGMYARQFGVSVRRARLMVDEDVASLRKDLYKQGSISIGKLGKLSLLEDGRLLFVPEEDMVRRSSAQSYGLLPLVASARWATSQGGVSLAKNGSKNPNYFYFRVSKKSMQRAAVVAVGLLCMLPVKMTPTSDHDRAGVHAFDWVKTAPIRSEKPTLEKSIPMNEEVAIPLQSQDVDQPSQATQPQQPWIDIADLGHGAYCVVSTFTSITRAQTYVDSVDQVQDREKLQIVKKGKNYMVLYAERLSRTEAYNRLSSLTIDGAPIQGGWVLEVR